MSAILKKIPLVIFVGIAAWAYQSARPPPPRTLGSPDGPAITSTRIKLRDGRHLAYEESGVPKEIAKAKIVFVHGFGGSKYYHPFATVASPALVKELGAYFVSLDRPGYGQSDPDPKRTLKSLALDIEELADQLNLGPKFYVVGYSMGGQIIWSCLKYISHRLAGAVLISPAVNYWWPNLPSNLTNEAYSRQLEQDQWSLRVAHYLPWLTYWWNTQRWFPCFSLIHGNPATISPPDREVFAKIFATADPLQMQIIRTQPTQQGKFESLHRDLNIGFGKWEFDPLELENPFPNKDGKVHLWKWEFDIFLVFDQLENLLDLNYTRNLKMQIIRTQPTQQGEFESLHRDLNIGFGKWDFDPLELENPFPNKDGKVHLWMGNEDLIVPVTLQRYIAQRLEWVEYHEVNGTGHTLPYADGMSDDILKRLLKDQN